MHIVKSYVSGSILVVILLGLVMLCGTKLAFPQDTKKPESSERDLIQDAAGDKDYVPGQVIVKYREGASSNQKAETQKANGAEFTIREITPKEGAGISLLKLKPDVSVEEAVERLSSSPDVEYAEPNFIYKNDYTPNDPELPNQWGLNNYRQTGGTKDADIDAVEAWDIERGGSNPATVAVIDSGIDLNHPDLVYKIWKNSNEDPSNGIDDDGNGYIDDFNGYNWIGISQYDYVDKPWYFGDGADTQTFAQSITGTGGCLTSIGIMVNKVGSPTEPIFLYVRNSLYGPNLAKASILPSEITSSEDFVTKEFSSAVKLTSGTTYYLVFKTFQEDTSNYYRLYDLWEVGDWFKDGCEWRWDSSTSNRSLRVSTFPSEKSPA